MSARIRDAATVVLIKDSASPGVDVWMLKRISELKFAPQAHVFPGGAVDKADDEHIPLTGGNLDELSQVMGVDPAKANRLISAAVRETFEESGVVLALNPETFEFTEEHRLQLLQGDVSKESFASKGIQEFFGVAFFFSVTYCLNLIVTLSTMLPLIF